MKLISEDRGIRSCELADPILTFRNLSGTWTFVPIAQDTKTKDCITLDLYLLVKEDLTEQKQVIK